MKTRSVLLTALAALLLSTLLAPAAVGQAGDHKQIQKPPLPAFKPQQPKRVALPNGMVIFLQEDHELPLIDGIAHVRGGSREEPAEKVGLTSIYGQAWRTGGTKTRTGDELDEFLESRAARVEASGDADSTNLSFSTLKGDFDAVFEVFLDVLRSPEFREDKIELAKTQENTAISRRNDSFTGISSREGAKLAYGAANPYARHTEYASVAAVKRDDLLNWHKERVHPNNIILGIIGDFDSAAMEAKLKKSFASWPKGPAAAAAKVEFQRPKPGVYFIQKDDVNQSAIRMVDLGIQRNDPDYYAVEVLNEVFGGGFSARLFSNIRSKKGLAYAVGGGVGSSFDHPGVLQLVMTTKSGTTAESIDALYQEVDDILGPKPATADELQRAKESILNSFVFRFDSKQKILNEQMLYEFYGYPADFLERYRTSIEKVTVEQVQQMAHKYLHKDRLAVLVVGKSEDFDRPLSSFGTVTAVNIDIPTGKAEKKAAGAKPAASSAEAKAMLAQVVQGMGGKDKVHSVKSVRIKGTRLAKTPQGDVNLELEAVYALPDRVRMSLQTPMGEMVRVLNPEGAFMMMGGGTRDLPAAQREEFVKAVKRDMLIVAQQADNPKYIFTVVGSEKIGEVDAQILEIDADGSSLSWYVDPATGHVLRASYQSMGMAGPEEIVQDFSEWKTVDGLTMPFRSTMQINGQEGGWMQAGEVQLNPEVDPKQFEKPPAPAPPSN